MSGFAMGLLVGLAFDLLPRDWGTAVGAAWAQAILSFLAILAAALFPWWHEKRSIRRKVDVLIGLIARAEGEARQLAENLRLANGRSLLTLEPRQWERIERTFAGIPQHEIPDTRIQWAISDSLGAVEQVRCVYERSQQPGYVVTTTDFLWVKDQADVLDQCYEDAVEFAEASR
ncbi:hypothetical protein K3217_05285 [bacterium BD-1]|nr:hypothetical protein [Ottowia caeni]